MWTLDVKAGYHHALMHPNDWTHQGTQFESQWLAHAALPFGMSQAPERFTQVMQLASRPLLGLWEAS